MTFHIHSIADSVIIYGLGTTAVFVASVVVRKVFEYFTTVVCYTYFGRKRCHAGGKIPPLKLQKS